MRRSARCQPTIVLSHHARRPGRLGQHVLHRQGVDVDEAILEQVQCKDRDFLILKPLGRHLAALATALPHFMSRHSLQSPDQRRVILLRAAVGRA